MIQRTPSFPNIGFSINGNGDITIGATASAPCAATAANKDQSLAMLVRREGETLEQLLLRLDRAIELANDNGIFIDEINNGLDDMP